MVGPDSGDGNYDEVAQKVNGGSFNRVEHARFMVANNHWYSGDAIGDMAVTFRIYNESVYPNGDIFPPSDMIWESDTIYVTDTSAWDAFGQLWIDVDIPDVFTNGDFWVGYKAFNLGGNRIRAVNDGSWGPGHINGGSWLFYYPWSTWIPTERFPGDHAGDDWWIDVEFCSVQFYHPMCGIADWGTLQGNFQRTGYSPVGLGDAKCDLTLDWTYVHPSGRYGQYTGPIIYNNTIVATFRSNSGTEYKTFDLKTKTEGYTINTDGNVTGMPTVHQVDGMDMMFVSGGNSNNIVQAYDFATGTLLWDIDAGMNPLPGMGASETNPYANFIVWNK